MRFKLNSWKPDLRADEDWLFDGEVIEPLKQLAIRLAEKAVVQILDEELEFVLMVKGGKLAVHAMDIDGGRITTDIEWGFENYFNGRYDAPDSDVRGNMVELSSKFKELSEKIDKKLAEK